MRGLDFKFMLQCIPHIMEGVPYTLEIAVVALIFGTLLGLFSALVRIYKIPVLSQLASVYIAIVRGTPLMIQILVAYYGIPRLLEYINYVNGTDININKIPAMYFMYVCFSVYIGSYLSEMIRSCIISIDPGQMEACLSIGMSTVQGLYRVVLPQAITMALPNFGNTFISLIKDASLAFAVSIPEILGQSKILAGRSSKFLEAYLVAAAFYFVICTVCQFGLTIIEKKSRKFEKK